MYISNSCVVGKKVFLFISRQSNKLALWEQSDYIVNKELKQVQATFYHCASLLDKICSDLSTVPLKDISRQQSDISNHQIHVK